MGSFPVLVSVVEPEPGGCAYPHCTRLALDGDHAEAGTETFATVTPTCSKAVVVVVVMTEVDTEVETEVVVRSLA